MKDIFDRIEKIVKTGAVYICPGCGEVTEIHSNPFYMHICDRCGWEGSYRDCRLKTTKEALFDLLGDRYYTKEDMLSALSLGMHVRQDQLNGYEDRSGKEIFEEFLVGLNK